MIRLALIAFAVAACGHDSAPAPVIARDAAPEAPKGPSLAAIVAGAQRVSQQVTIADDLGPVDAYLVIRAGGPSVAHPGAQVDEVSLVVAGAAKSLRLELARLEVPRATPRPFGEVRAAATAPLDGFPPLREELQLLRSHVEADAIGGARAFAVTFWPEQRLVGAWTATRGATEWQQEPWFRIADASGPGASIATDRVADASTKVEVHVTEAEIDRGAFALSLRVGDREGPLDGVRGDASAGRWNVAPVTPDELASRFHLPAPPAATIVGYCSYTHGETKNVLVLDRDDAGLVVWESDGGWHPLVRIPLPDGVDLAMTSSSVRALPPPERKLKVMPPVDPPPRDRGSADATAGRTITGVGED